MAETITPVVHGGRRSKWALSLALHSIAATAAAAAFGSVVAMAGGVAGGPWPRGGLFLIGLAGVLYAARELFDLPVPIPQRRRQVPQWWREAFPAPAASLLYGLGLGVGFLTFVRYGTLVVVTTAAFVAAHPLLGAVLLAPFGAARGLSILVLAPARSAAQVQVVVGRLERMAATPILRIVNGGVLVAVAVLAWRAAADIGAVDVLPFGVLLLGCVFAWSFVVKLVDPGRWRRDLAAYALGRVGQPIALAVVPVAEALIGWLLLVEDPTLGGVAALTALVGFSVALVRARLLRGPRFVCGCLGDHSPRSFRFLLVRNGVLAAVAAWVALGPASAPLPSVPDTRGNPLPLVLTVLGAVVAVWVGAILRRSIGSLQETMDQAAEETRIPERRAPFGR